MQNTHKTETYMNASLVSSPPQLKFPADVEIVELVGAFTHLVASDAEGCAYTCGHGTHGQLGHGESRQNTVSYRPRRVDRSHARALCLSLCLERMDE